MPNPTELRSIQPLAITGPATYPRNTSEPPPLAIDVGEREFYAVEVATDPTLFPNPAGRTADNFYASYQDGGRLLDTAEYTTIYRLPSDAWKRLRMAHSLYLRVLTSASPTEWRNTETSLPAGSTTPPPSIRLHGQFTLDVEGPFREEERLWRRDPRV
jgi:hypothetical protein